MDFYKLPIYRQRGQVIAALARHQVVIVESPTGSGKTTQLPLILHEAGYTRHGAIGVTQPRRLATLAVSDFIARQLHAELGGLVGYKMRFEDVTSPETKIKVMTDGTLLQELKHDPLLQSYTVMMVDEAHERSLTIDFILGLLKELLPKRPDFRLLVSSATIRTEVFSSYFADARGVAPVLSIAAESFPVQVIYRPPPSAGRRAVAPRTGQAKGQEQSREKAKGKDKDSGKNASAASEGGEELGRLNPVEALAQQVSDIILRLGLPGTAGTDDCKAGDVLVFLPGEANIKACVAMLQPYQREYGLYILPLYARLGKEEQQRIFAAAPRSQYLQRPCRKVILATNIAETSITIDGITVVIDTGKSKLSHFDSYKQHAELREGNISRASAEQRQGRAGRLAPGLCYRLYKRSEYWELRPYTQEEIQRTDLTEVVLRMAELGLRAFEDFDFLTRPDRREIYNAVESLVQLGALHSDRTLTAIGREMCHFPLLPRHARILIAALHIGRQCLHPACVITAFLSSNSPFLFPHGQEQQARAAQSRFMDKHGDFAFYLNVYEHYCAAHSTSAKQQFCERYFLDQQAMHELQRIVAQLKDIIYNEQSLAGLTGAAAPPPSEPSARQGERYHREYMLACLAGLQSGICLKEDNGAKNKRRTMYRSFTTKNIMIHPGSSMFGKPARYLLAGEIMRTSQTYARAASPLEASWLDSFAPTLRRKLEQLNREENKSDR